MDTKNGLNRHTQYALMSALAAGIVSFILITLFIDMLTLLFIPAVMIMVFISAYFAFKRRTKSGGVLTRGRIFGVAFEVGTLTHFYTFAFYLPIVYFAEGSISIDAELFGIYIFWTIIAGIASLIMFVWIAVPMYIGIGYLQKAIEGGEYGETRSLDESILDDGLLSPDLD